MDNNFSDNNSHDINNNIMIDNDDDDNNNNGTSKQKPVVFRKCLKIIGLLSLSVCLGFGIGFSIPVIQAYANKNVNNDTELNKDTNKTTISNQSNKVINIVHSSMPSIVSINTKSKSQNIFNLTFENTGTGSGIIFYKTSTNAYIVTNHHVIENATAVDISINNSKTLVPASLVGKDVNSDLAVLSINMKDLHQIGIKNVTVAAFGDSDNLAIGDSAIAIGNALGEGTTATLGLISAIQDNVTIGNTRMSVIQTDAAINPGNSGGALINSKGEVIGINTAKLASNTIEGIGYSISSNVAKPIIEQIMNNTNPASLGVYISNVTKEVANLYGIEQTGALIAEVMKGGSADKAGLKAYDIIIGFNDNPIFSSEQLMEHIKKSKANDTVELKVLRNGSPSKVKVRLQQSNIDTSF